MYSKFSNIEKLEKNKQVLYCSKGIGMVYRQKYH